MVGVRCSLSCRIHTLDETANPSSVEGPFMSFFLDCNPFCFAHKLE